MDTVKQTLNYKLETLSQEFDMLLLKLAEILL